ncbi:MAG TPA: hypothetical protein VME69_11605 [Methylocella sp.]|nr:hypothetical protein [Methylocella sp.]
MILRSFCLAAVSRWVGVFLLLIPCGAFPAPTKPGTDGQPRAGARPAPAPIVANLPVPARLGGAPDRAYAAYQRGYFLTAMQEAMKRVEADSGDGPAMTLMAELYAQGLGVRRDAGEAARWYRLAASNGDRQAIFALGMATLKGEGVAAGSGGRCCALGKGGGE